MLDAKLVRAFAIDYPEVVRSINKFYLQDIKTFLVADAKRRAPINKKVGTGGALRKSIRGRVKGDVAIIFTDLDYASHVEYGTRPHTIKAKNVPVLSDGKSVFGKTVNHPGTAAQPYMRPTIDENRRHIIGRWRSLFRKTFRALGKL